LPFGGLLPYDQPSRMLRGGDAMANKLEILKLALEIALIAIQIYFLLKSKKPK
jgi:hypothetical protein